MTKAAQHERREEETALLIVEIQSSLQQQMSAKAEAENMSRLLESKMKNLQEVNNKQAQELANLADLQSVLQDHMEAKAEAEQKSRSFVERVSDLEATIQTQSSRIESLERELIETREDKALQQDELEKIRAERDEQQRKEQALTFRLNAAKTQQAEQSNLVERFEDEIRALEQDLEAANKELTEVSQAKVVLENELEVVKKTSDNRVRQAEAALLDERSLNEERKRKMKAFVENKSEELRQAKADNDSLHTELTQTNKSLIDLNNRWKQLHAQWVQSQTRNRELQRDLNRIKKDSENLHKVGDTLEMKLSRSATETEEHKNKRLAAKHELMTVLRTLEAERELTAKLRDSLKFTFTPKALSQQQLLHEGLQDFETQLQKLATRLGRTLPPMPDSDQSASSDTGDHTGLVSDAVDLVVNGGGDDAGRLSRTDAEIQRLIAKLEYETQRVSQGIMALSGSIDRMHLILDASGDRTCYTVLSELLTTGAVRTTAAAAASPEETRRLGSIRSSHQYGHIPNAARD
jgi:chromosome segregation ATPase